MIVDDEASLRDHAPDSLACLAERGQVGTQVRVDGGRHRDHEEVATREIVFSGGKFQRPGERHLRLGHLARAVVATLQLVDARLVGVETHNREFSREIGGERQPDIAEADHADAQVLELGQSRLGHGAPS
jgi:hypothetical protein